MEPSRKKKSSHRDLFESGVYFDEEGNFVKNLSRPETFQLYGHRLCFPPVKTAYSTNASTHHTVIRTYSILNYTNYTVTRCVQHDLVRYSTPETFSSI